jgi:hypothetical protein
MRVPFCNMEMSNESVSWRGHFNWLIDLTLVAKLMAYLTGRDCAVLCCSFCATMLYHSFWSVGKQNASKKSTSF